MIKETPATWTLDDVQYLNVEYLQYYVRRTADVDVEMKSKRSLRTHVTLKDRKRSLGGKNYRSALWHFRKRYNAKFRVVAVFKQPQHVVACEDMPWCESGVVAVKGKATTGSDFMKIPQDVAVVSFYIHDAMWDSFNLPKGS